MSDRATEERLAAHLKAGVAALRQGRSEQALLHLRPVVDDPDLAAADDLGDVRSRACSLLAQALLSLPLADETPAHLDEVERWLHTAQALDPEAADGVAVLRDQLLERRRTWLESEARQARTKRLAATDVEPLLAKIRDPERKMDLLLQKAQAELEVGRPEVAIALAQRVLSESASHSDVRLAVMAHLSLARARPENAEAHIAQALALADGADEFNLVSTIARTAEHLDVVMPVHRGAHERTIDASGNVR